MKKMAFLFSVLALTACTTMDVNQAIVPLQTATAKMIGLASSDELTVSNVRAQDPDALGSQTLTYVATTTKGRSFNCKAVITPGLLLNAPTVSNPSCTPVQVHR